MHPRRCSSREGTWTLDAMDARRTECPGGGGGRGQEESKRMIENSSCETESKLFSFGGNPGGDGR
jgi:hypothetical protein